MKRCVLLSLLLAVALSLSACSWLRKEITPADKATGQPLRVGMTTDNPPITYRKDGRIVGLEPSLAQGLGRFSNRKIEMVELMQADLIPALLDKRIDIIMAGLTVDQASGKPLAFTDPYLMSGQICLVRLDDHKRYTKGASDLLKKNVRVGTIRNSDGDLFLQEIGVKKGKTLFTSVDQGIQALIGKKIDAFVHDLPAGFYYAARYVDQGVTPVVTPMTRESLVWGVRRDDETLQKTANLYLDSVRQSGELRKMIERWIPFSQQP
jgi:ABC-type amino acid transport substrate-binding protein